MAEKDKTKADKDKAKAMSLVANDKRKIKTFWTDSDILLYYNYFNNERLEPHRQSLNERKSPLGNSISYRTINHWENSGLIDVDRGEAGKGWRKYSAMDAIWINLIIELRNFGVSIENIRKIKEQLTERTGEPEYSAYPKLEFHSSLFMLDKEETYILIPNNFVIEIATQSQITFLKSVGGMCNHISISLHDIIKKVYNKHDLKLKGDERTKLSDEEAALIKEIRKGGCKSIKVKMKSGKMHMLEKDMEVTEKQLYKIMKEKNYDTITVKRENGKVVVIEQVIKNKL